MKEEKLDGLKKQLSFYKYSLLALWVCLFLFFYIFRTSSDLINTPLNDLNAIGGFFNIVTSLTGVITVFLLAKAVIFQKEELINIQEQVIQQRKSLEREERTNRTIRMIERWSNIESLDFMDYVYESLKFIKTINLMVRYSTEEEYSFNSKLDFQMIARIIILSKHKNRIEQTIDDAINSSKEYSANTTSLYTLRNDSLKEYNSLILLNE